MTDMPVSLPVPGSLEERIAMINELLGDRPPNYEIGEHPFVRRIKGYRLALITDARCGSDTVDGGCARYPHHAGGHCTYPLPGDPGYDASPAAQAMVRMVDEARAVVEQLTGETPLDGFGLLDPDGRPVKAADTDVPSTVLQSVTHHTVADIEPSTENAELSALWDHVALVRNPPGTVPLIRVLGLDDISPVNARHLAAELLSAAARAERTTPMLQSPSEANPVD